MQANIATKNNQLNIRWKSSVDFNQSRRKRLVPIYIRETVENLIASGKMSEVKESTYKSLNSRIITGISHFVPRTVEIEHTVETFKNVKSLEKAEIILAKRNKNNIFAAYYNGVEIYKGKEEETAVIVESAE